MAITAIADVIVPEVLADQVSAKYPDHLVLGNSSLVEVDGTFPLGSPGTAFKMPFWKRVAAFGALTEGTAMTTAKIQAAAEFAVVQRGGAAYEVYDTAQLVSKADPTAEVADQIARRAAEYIDAALVVCASATPNLSNITITGGGTGGIITQNSVMTALTSTLGDNYGNMLSGGAIFMHSKVYNDLIATGAIQNQYQSGMDTLRTGVLPTISGLPIILSDRVTISTVSGTNAYATFIIGPASLALFYQRQVMVEFDRDILLQADVIAATVHFAPHLYGWDESAGAQAAEQAKTIHVVQLLSH